MRCMPCDVRNRRVMAHTFTIPTISATPGTKATQPTHLTPLGWTSGAVCPKTAEVTKTVRTAQPDGDKIAWRPWR